MIDGTFCGRFSAAINRFASLTLGRKIASSKSKTIGGRRRDAEQPLDEGGTDRKDLTVDQDEIVPR